MRIRRTLLSAASVMVVTLSFLATASAGPPEMIRYQGTIETLAGAPVQDGLCDFTVRIFDDPTDPPGSPAELFSRSLSAQVAGGAYTLVISPANPGDLTSALSDVPRYIEVTVDSGPGVSAPETLLPREEIASAPFALGTGVASPSAACPGAPGTLRYVASPPGLEVCDGTAWSPIGFRRLDEQVFSGTAPTNWTTLSVGAHTGPGPALVFLRVESPTNDPYVAVRPTGDSADWLYPYGYPHGAAMGTGGAGAPSLLIVTTDANGDFECARQPRQPSRSD